MSNRMCKAPVVLNAKTKLIMRMQYLLLPLLLASAVIAVTAGCGGSPPISTGSSAGAQSPEGSRAAQGLTLSPGHDTPEDAVDGLVSDELSGKMVASCSYETPSEQPACTAAASQAAPPTGSFKITGDLISGDLALVAATGQVCAQGNGCVTNTDPSAGLPGGTETFSQAYQKVLTDAGDDTATPCIKVNGLWYVNFTE